MRKVCSNRHGAPMGLPVGSRGLFGRFLRREDGTITSFAAVIFVLMVAAGGMSVDIMRFEAQRAQLQHTLDRAVLAAASLSQPLTPREVVENYFEVSGIENYRLDIVVDEGINFRRVHAYAEMEIQSIFMHIFGVRALTSPAEGAAEDRIRNVEVSMVLDISGSMGSQSRITNMRAAAREFVSTILQANQSEEGNLVSISIVPYNGMVNIGENLASVFTLSDEHDYSNCARFAPEDLATTAVNPASTIERIAHWDYDYYNSERLFVRPYCPTDEYGAIVPWSHDEDTLHDTIDDLEADGWTAIDMGMKWAVALLDPIAQPAVDGLIASSDVHEDFEGRPAAYDDTETVKAIVLMTDGDNTNQYDIREPYKSGLSPIFYHVDDDRYSTWVASQEQFWISSDEPDDYSGWWDDEPWQGDESLALSWTYLWANYTARYTAEVYLRVPAWQSGDWTLFNSIRSDGDYMYAGRTQADTNLGAICDAANAQGILVFSIAFEAPTGGQTVLRQCASSDAHYYDVDGIEISDAFASIAQTINQLRLIQ